MVEQMAKRWYVIHTYSGHENKVKDYLENAIKIEGMEREIGQIVIPTEEVVEMKGGERMTTAKKFLPSYILIEMEMGKETRHLIVNTPGVTSFVGARREPQPLQDKEVEEILERMDRSKGKGASVAPFQVGDTVKVIDGPFSDFSGMVKDVNPERGKVKVMVSIFGRPTPVELDFLQVERIG